MHSCLTFTRQKIKTEYKKNHLISEKEIRLRLRLGLRFIYFVLITSLILVLSLDSLSKNLLGVFSCSFPL